LNIRKSQKYIYKWGAKLNLIIMADPHFCQNCQFCVPILGKSKEILRLECWKNPPNPVYAGTDSEGKFKIIHVRPKIEPAWKCSEWKEKKMGFW